MKKIIALILSIVGLTIPYCIAQSIHFERRGLNDGLSHNSVISIIQDSNGFMWFGTKDGLNCYDGKSFKIFKHNLNNHYGLGNSSIRCLSEDNNHHILVGTSSGLFVYNMQYESFTEVPLFTIDHKPVYRPVMVLKCDRKGHVWFLVENNGIFMYDSQAECAYCVYDKQKALRYMEIDNNETIWFSDYGGRLYYTKNEFETVELFQPSIGEECYSNDIISSICFGKYNKMYLGLEANGVAEVDLVTLNVSRLPIATPLFVRRIIQYTADELWIGTESGIFVYNTRTHAVVEHLQSSMYDPYSLSDNAIYSLYKDREDGLWVGSFFGGINYLPERNSNFEMYYPTDNPHSLQGKCVREICKGIDGKIWVGTEDAGIYSFDPKTKMFDFCDASSEFTNVHGLLMDGDNLWVSTFSKGIRVIDTRTGKVIRKYDTNSKPNRLFSNYVFALCKTHNGVIYVGTMHGLQYYDRASDGFRYVPEINGGKMVNDIKEDSKGNLWVATISNGIYRYDALNNEWKQYLNDKQDAHSLPYNNVLSIFEDANRSIWLTTEGTGFCRFDPANNNFIRYNSSDGLPSDVVFQIVEDDDGYFWITTSKGLVLFDPNLCIVKRVYTVNDGLLSNQFNYKSSYKSDSGKIYFGCIAGLIAFDAHALTEHKTKIAPVLITDFSLLDETIIIGERNSPLQKSIIFSDSICLKFKQNSFALQIAALSYSESHVNTIQYKLDGFDNNWRQYTPDMLKITYTKVPSGKYNFKVRLLNGADAGAKSSVIKEKSLFIKILPPFYLSTFAFVLYFLLCIGLITVILSYYNHRNRVKLNHDNEVFAMEKERELYDAKINFFTDIAHEIRTPLTLIKGPLENILSKPTVKKDIAEDLEIMDRNTCRLLDLTNQLLDFQKVEKERMSLNIAKSNVADIVRDVFYRFSSSAKQQNKLFDLSIENEAIYAYVDQEALTKILSNLLNNALKYSDKSIRGKLTSDDNSFSVSVVNDGEMVPAEIREMVFTPFFRHTQKKNTIGTGIGLSVAKSLAELHRGTLTMGEDENKSEFILTIPLRRTDEVVTEEEEEIISGNIQESSTKKYSLLIVEDNLEMLDFIKRQLSNQYTTMTAANGVEALGALEKNRIDLVISDIMMPEMNGIELCRRIKNDLQYSHIPLILLTAKTNLQSKISGFNVGADAYVEKPFSYSYLSSIIANLISNRQKLCVAFTKNPMVMASTMATSTADAEFIVRLQDIIHANFNNPNFMINDISNMMHMSKANFYRKINGIWDMTPTEYLRLERLKTAAQLLKDKQYRINEVCYMVGFSSTSYFAKCFQKQFGVTPTKFVEDTSGSEDVKDGEKR